MTAALPIKNAAGTPIADAHYPLFELALLPVFAGISIADLAVLLETAWVQHYSDGHLLFRSGSAATHFFAILDGHVELFMEDGSGRNVLDIAQSPTLLGEAALYGDGLYLESARTVGHTRLLVVPAQWFLAVLNRRFDLARRLLSSMSARLHGLVTQISSLKIKSTAQRLAGYLLGIADTQGNITTARFPYDKRLVADYLGMSAESLSRALGRLAPLGVTSHSDNIVTIADLAALRTFCGEDEAE